MENIDYLQISGQNKNHWQGQFQNTRRGKNKGSREVQGVSFNKDQLIKKLV